MRKISWLVLILISFAALPQAVFADTGAAKSAATSVPDSSKPIEFHLKALPFEETLVSGDKQRYQADHWRSAGYNGGVDEFLAKYEAEDGLTAEIEGSALMHTNNYSSKVEIHKEDFGYFEFDYHQFRKYYDDNGGVYYPFLNKDVYDLNRELYVDIAKIEVEAGITVPDMPHVALYYEHESKEGAKSRLTWATVTEGATTRKIAPSWQEIDENVDVFGIKGSHDVAGIHFKADQQFEVVSSKNRRYEVQRSETSNTESAYMVRIQDQRPEARVMTTTFGGEKWSEDNKYFTSGAYRFERIRNEEREDLKEYNALLVPRNFSGFSENKINANADNYMNTHRWVVNFMASPWSVFAANSKFKFEVGSREGHSYYPQANRPAAPAQPDYNTIIRTEVSSTFNKQTKLGETFGVRYKGIPKTALYSELEFEQAINDITEMRDSLGTTPSDGEKFFRDSTTFTPSTLWVTGADFMPVRMVNFANQFRIRREKNNYDDGTETDGSSSSARSAFMDEVSIQSAEYSSRITIRPIRWYQTSFRYMLNNVDYWTRVESQTDVQTDFRHQTFVWDQTITPTSELSFTGSITKRFSMTETPASSEPSTARVPAFRSDFTTWMFITNYQPCEKFSVITDLYYTYTRNFDEAYAFEGLSLGSDYDRVGIDVKGLWKVSKDVSLGPKYSYYLFSPNEHAEAGGYRAHLFGVEVMTEWG